LTEIRQLRAVYEAYPHFYVLNDRALLPSDMEGNTYFITHSERDWKMLLNLWEAFQLLRAHRPRVILSSGAGPAVPFALVGRLLFGTRVVFVETVTRIHSPSLTGRLMYWLAHDFYYQWRPLAKFFPRATYGGPLV
jgi:beta-1,4-N-acetylglucosaminyltransferase